MIVEEFLSLKIKETDIDKILLKLENKTISKIRDNMEKNKQLNNLIIDDLIYYININLDLFINIIKYMKNNEQKIHEECEKLSAQYVKEKKDMEDSLKDKNEKELKKLLIDFEKRKKRIIFLMEKNYKELMAFNDYNNKMVIYKCENTIAELEKKQKEIIAKCEKYETKEKAMIAEQQAMISEHKNYIAEHEKKEQELEHKYDELQNKYQEIIFENDKRFKELENKMKENDILKKEKYELINNSPKIKEIANLKTRIEELEFELKAKDNEIFYWKFLSHT